MFDRLWKIQKLKSDIIIKYCNSQLISQDELIFQNQLSCYVWQAFGEWERVGHLNIITPG